MRTARAKRGSWNSGRCADETQPEPAPAFEPWSEGASGARAVDALCRRIAATIKSWLDQRRDAPFRGRPITPGDILILVRRREPFTAPMIRALKRDAAPRSRAPTACALMGQLAVQDLVALADMLLMPADDLALAVALKSPLFGLDDDALFDLAHERRASLWSSLLRQGRRIHVSTKRRRGSSDGCPRPISCRLMILRRAARCRGPGDAQAHADASRSGSRRGDRRVSRRSHSHMTGRRPRRCKDSSISCAPATSRSSATWSRTATKSVS